MPPRVGSLVRPEAVEGTVLRPIDLPAPAKGLNPIYTVPGGKWWRVVTFGGRLVTSLVVGNREAVFEWLDPAGGIRYAVPSGQTQAANSFFRYYAAAAAGWPVNLAQWLGVQVPVPDVILPPGWTFGFLTVALDAADQWDQIVLVVEESILGPRGYPSGVLSEADEERWNP